MFIGILLTIKCYLFSRQHSLLIVSSICATPTGPRKIVSTPQLRQLGLKVLHEQRANNLP